MLILIFIIVSKTLVQFLALLVILILIMDVLNVLMVISIILVIVKNVELTVNFVIVYTTVLIVEENIT